MDRKWLIDQLILITSRPAISTPSVRAKCEYGKSKTKILTQTPKNTRTVFAEK